MLNNAGLVIALILGSLQIIVIVGGGLRFFTDIRRRLERIEYEYRPNAGTSMRDAINRIENKLAKLEGKFEQHIEESVE